MRHFYFNIIKQTETSVLCSHILRRSFQTFYFQDNRNVFPCLQGHTTLLMTPDHFTLQFSECLSLK